MAHKTRSIYLAGPMENVSEDQMTGWRKIATGLLIQDERVKILDPSRRRHSGEQRHMRRIFEMDLRDIREADIILVNLNSEKLAKHGTAMEVFYASYDLRKPVVAFKEGITRYHPFFESLVTEWRSTVEKACETIIEEYLH